MQSVLTVDQDGQAGHPCPLLWSLSSKPPAITPCHPQLHRDLLTTLLAADGAHTDPSLVPARAADLRPKVSMINRFIVSKALTPSAVVELKNK